MNREAASMLVWRIRDFGPMPPSPCHQFSFIHNTPTREDQTQSVKGNTSHTTHQIVQRKLNQFSHAPRTHVGGFLAKGESSPRLEFRQTLEFIWTPSVAIGNTPFSRKKNWEKRVARESSFVLMEPTTLLGISFPTTFHRAHQQGWGVA